MPTKINNKQDIAIAELRVEVKQNTKAIESLTGKVSSFWNDLGHVQKDVASLSAGQKITYGLMTVILASLIAIFLK